MKKKAFYLKGLLVLILTVATSFANAQGPGGINGGLGGGISPDDQQSQQGTSVPVDLGIGVMVAAGVAYSIKRKKRKSVR